MFWGLVLEPGKRYSTTVDKAFHISMAVLDCATVNSDHEVLYVLLENDGQEYRICNLSKKGYPQVNLDLNFVTGDAIAFELKGSGIVHLSGYIIPGDDDVDFLGDEDDEDLDEAEDEEEEEKGIFTSKKVMLKGSKKTLANAKKIQKMEESDDDDDDDEDDDDNDDSSEVDDDDDDDDEEEEEEEDEDDDDDDDDEDEDEEKLKQKILSLKKGGGGQLANKKGQIPAGKLQTTPGQKGGKPQTPTGKPQTPAGKPQTPSGKPQTPAGKPQTPAGKMLNGTSPDNQQQQSGKKRKRRSRGGAGGEQQSPNTATQQQQPQPNSQQKANKTKKQRMSNGLTIKDLKVGNGPVAKPGQTVSVWYEGRLASTGKTFDACRRNAAPFRFRLGRSEVIKAWDEGVAGMQVGGQRVITCPPHLAYGSRGAPPAIPPNSTLVFQVELKAVR